MADTAVTGGDGVAPAEAASSFAKSLFLGEIHGAMVFPYPRPDDAEEQRIRRIVRALDAFAKDYDERATEEARRVSDDDIARLGEIGALGLYVEPELGGQGLSQTGYARVFEAIAGIDPTLSVVLGVHQSIGYKGIALFGTPEQRARWLPDLATGRKLAAFALTEPNAGSDAWNIESRAVRQPDGSWVLNGEKRYIGNGSRADVLTTFARCEVDGKDRHIALLVERGMKGFEVGERYDTMGLRANDLRHLRFNDVRVPPENVLGEPGEGFRIAMAILNNGRIGLGTGSVGGGKALLELTLAHVSERRQFGAPLADLELVQEKLGWMVSDLFGLESMCYLTTGLVDRGVHDYSLESAVCKIAGTEFLWYQANRALQLAGGEGYMRTRRYEKILRDIRIFPIFEGANDVLRSYVALTGMKPLGEKLSELGNIGLSDPIGSLGVLVDYVGARVRAGMGAERLRGGHAELERHADAVSEQVGALHDACAKLLREHRGEILHRGLHHKRVSDAVTDIYAQIAVISRVSGLLEDQGVELSGQERFIADVFCNRAALRVRASLRAIERNDDDAVTAIARLAARHGAYGYDLAAP
jgi:acyl-CoA dehydrogenase family protein 9